MCKVGQKMLEFHGYLGKMDWDYYFVLEEEWCNNRLEMNDFEKNLRNILKNWNQAIKCCRVSDKPKFWSSILFGVVVGSLTFKEVSHVVEFKDFVVKC